MNDKKEKGRSGEAGFAVCLLALSIFLLSGSIQLFREDPRFSGAGGLPLILSVLLVGVVCIILLQNVRQKKTAEGWEKGGFLEVLKEIFPRDIVVFIAILMVYCVGLFLHLGFYPCTFVFLVAAMTYMDPKGWKWNLFTTVILLAAIYGAFTVIFKVQLP